MDLYQVILQHILTTVVIILAGFLVGGGLGILFAWLFRSLCNAAPGLRPPLVLLPWRTILFALVLFFCSPMAYFVTPQVAPYAALHVPAAVYPVLTFTLIVCFFVADAALAQWLPTGLGVRLTGLARTFAVACGVIVAVGANVSQSGILYYALRRAAMFFTPDSLWIALGVVMGLGLILDLLLGIVQMLLVYAERRRATKQTAPSQGD